MAFMCFKSFKWNAEGSPNPQSLMWLGLATPPMLRQTRPLELHLRQPWCKLKLCQAHLSGLIPKCMQDPTQNFHLVPIKNETKLIKTSSGCSIKQISSEIFMGSQNIVGNSAKYHCWKSSLEPVSDFSAIIFPHSLAFPLCYWNNKCPKFPLCKVWHTLHL